MKYCMNYLIIILKVVLLYTSFNWYFGVLLMTLDTEVGTISNSYMQLQNVVVTKFLTDYCSSICTGVSFKFELFSVKIIVKNGKQFGH